MENSKIEWTDHTFNPWVGCTKVSDGCKNCYAETLMDHRYGKVKWGPQGARIRTSAAYWKQPLKWNREAAAEGVRRRVFCGSLCDAFEVKEDQREEIQDWRLSLYATILATPHLDWLLLTKRPENIADLTPVYWQTDGWPSNIWIGTSIEDQTTADERIPHLLNIPGAVRFLSVEPLLGPVDLVDDKQATFCHFAGCVIPGECDHPGTCRGRGFMSGIDWVIVGGESGPGARPMHPRWVQSLRDQCVGAGVPFFFKQWGEWELSAYEDLPNSWVDEDTGEVLARHRPYIEPPPFRSGAVMKRVGKSRAGRLLDGREWDEFPQPGG